MSDFPILAVNAQNRHRLSRVGAPGLSEHWLASPLHALQPLDVWPFPFSVTCLRPTRFEGWSPAFPPAPCGKQRCGEMLADLSHDMECAHKRDRWAVSAACGRQAGLSVEGSLFSVGSGRRLDGGCKHRQHLTGSGRVWKEGQCGDPKHHLRLSVALCQGLRSSSLCLSTPLEHVS